MAMRTETPSKLDLYRDLARQLRADIIRTSTAAGSGHPSSSLSATDLLAVLLAGHDLEEIDAAMTEAVDDGQPTAIIAKTKKGAGVSFLADQPNWHGKPLS